MTPPTEGVPTTRHLDFEYVEALEALDAAYQNVMKAMPNLVESAFNPKTECEYGDDIGRKIRMWVASGSEIFNEKWERST